MNIHEFQAKELFVKFGVGTSPGKVARTPDEAEAVAKELKSDNLVVKAQIHAGGRGKGVFKNGFKGGVHLCKTPAEVKEIASKMLGQVLVTHQTGPEGKLVSQILIAIGVDISKEYYLAVLMDRATSAPIVIASTEGGVDIETVAEKTPDKIFRESVHPLLGLEPNQARKIASELGFKGPQFRQFTDLLQSRSTSFSSAAIARWWKSIRSWSHPTAACSRSMRNSTSTTTRFSGIPTSWRCATPARRIPARSRRASSA